MRQWMLRTALWQRTVAASASQSTAVAVPTTLLVKPTVVPAWRCLLHSNRRFSVSSVPDRRKRNHFNSNKKQRPTHQNNKKQTDEAATTEAPANVNTYTNHKNGGKMFRASFIKTRHVADRKKAPVFTNKFQNLLSFSLDDEDDKNKKNDDVKAKKETDNDEDNAFLMGNNLLGLNAFGLDKEDFDNEDDDAKPHHHYHHMRHKDRVRKEQQASAASLLLQSTDTTTSLLSDKNKQTVKGKRKKDGRSLLKNFKFENSIFDDADDEELFGHVDWDEEKKDRREQRRMQREERKKERNASRPVDLPPQEVEIPTTISVKDLAERMAIKSRILIKTLKDLGESGLDDEAILTYDIAEVAVEALNMIPVLLPPDFVDVELTIPPADCSMFPSRPPILSVMGHVDHGKTTLLDALRKSKVAASEHGGITQSIGAFTVNIGKNFGKMSTMTFIDTPGHAAFSSMRSRGSEVTDMIVLVVAADDGVRPQTVEVVQLALKNNVPVVVAITKCDMHGHDEQEVVHRISSELLAHGLVTEPMGGESPVVCVSGKTGQGLDGLKETIALHAEVMDLRADTNAKGEAVVLEANMARGVGTQVDAIVKWGTLENGDIVVCGLEYGKIRALVDQSGKRTKQMTPGHPVRVIGLKGLPNAGDSLLGVENEERAKEVIEQRRELIEWDLMAASDDQDDQDDGIDASTDKFKPRRRKFRNANKKWEVIELRRRQAAEEAKRIATLKAGDDGYVASIVPIIVKTDAVGVITAIDDLIASLPSDEAVIKRIMAAVGPVTSSDIEMAAATGATIYAFNIKHPGTIDKEALEKNVNLRQHRVIYSMLDDIKELLREHLSGEEQEEIVGTAEIVQAIPISTTGRRTTNIAGCKVTMGSMNMQCKYRLLRNGEVVADNLSMNSMRHFQERVSEVTKGQECGLHLHQIDQFQPGDLLQAYTVKIVKKAL